MHENTICEDTRKKVQNRNRKVKTCINYKNNLALLHINIKQLHKTQIKHKCKIQHYIVKHTHTIIIHELHSGSIEVYSCLDRDHMTFSFFLVYKLIPPQTRI